MTMYWLVCFFCIVYSSITNTDCIMSLTSGTSKAECLKSTDNDFDTYFTLATETGQNFGSVYGTPPSNRVTYSLPRPVVPNSVTLHFEGDAPETVVAVLCAYGQPTSDLVCGVTDIFQVAAGSTGCLPEDNASFSYCNNLTPSDCLEDSACEWHGVTITSDFLEGPINSIHNTLEDNHLLDKILFYFPAETELHLLEVDWDLNDQCLDSELNNAASACMEFLEDTCESSGNDCVWQEIEDGEWSDWDSVWIYTTTCDDECNSSGFATKERSRACINPVPTLNYGNGCVGDDTESATESCASSSLCIPEWGEWEEWISVIDDTDQDCRTDYEKGRIRKCYRLGTDVEIGGEYCIINDGGVEETMGDSEFVLDETRTCGRLQASCVDEFSSWDWFHCENVLDDDSSTVWEVSASGKTLGTALTTLMFEFHRDVDFRGIEMHFGSEQNPSKFTIRQGDTPEEASSVSGLSGDILPTHSKLNAILPVEGSANIVRAVEISFETANDFTVEELIIFGYSCNTEYMVDDSSILPGTFCEFNVDTVEFCEAGYYCEGTFENPPLPCPRGYYCSGNTTDPSLCTASDATVPQTELSNLMSTSEDDCSLCTDILEANACTLRDDCLYYNNTQCARAYFNLDGKYINELTTLTVDDFMTNLAFALNIQCEVLSSTYGQVITTEGVTLILFSFTGTYACGDIWGPLVSDPEWLDSVDGLASLHLAELSKPIQLSSDLMTIVDSGDSLLISDCLDDNVCVTYMSDFDVMLGYCGDGLYCVADLTISEDGTPENSWAIPVFIAIASVILLVTCIILVKRKRKEASEERKRAESAFQSTDGKTTQHEAEAEMVGIEIDGVEGGGMPPSQEPMGKSMSPSGASEEPMSQEYNREPLIVEEELGIPEEDNLFSVKRPFGGEEIQSFSGSGGLYREPGEGNISGAPGGARPYIESGFSEDDSDDDLYGRGAPGAPGGFTGAPGAQSGPGFQHSDTVFVDYLVSFINRVVGFDMESQDGYNFIDEPTAKEYLSQLRAIPIKSIMDSDPGLHILVGKTYEDLTSLLKDCPVSVVTDLNPGEHIGSLEKSDRVTIK